MQENPKEVITYLRAYEHNNVFYWLDYRTIYCTAKPLTIFEFGEVSLEAYQKWLKSAYVETLVEEADFRSWAEEIAEKSGCSGYFLSSTDFFSDIAKQIKEALENKS